ncbi:hypothetical protein Nmel_014354 [Mimus melanotis]
MKDLTVRGICRSRGTASAQTLSCKEELAHGSWDQCKVETRRKMTTQGIVRLTWMKMKMRRRRMI